VITFTVLGKAEPAGSKRAFALRRKGGALVLRENGAPVISVTDDNPDSKAWKQEIGKAALLARTAHPGYLGKLLDGPLAVSFYFYRPRPKGHSTSKGALSKAGRETPYPISKPDVLKLARGVEDALTSIIWRDDAQIVDERIRKFWGEPARVVITVAPL
jgi:Holliday junction resolvase RusA-like endonuclease